MRIKLIDLAPGIGYALQLQSITRDQQLSEWSRMFYIVTDSDAVSPKTPENLSGSSSGTSFSYTWDVVTQSVDDTAASDLDHYAVKIESSGSAAVGNFITVDNKFELSLEQNRTIFSTPQANIRCSVAAVDKVGNSSPYTVPVSLDNPPPSQPTDFTSSALQDTINLAWTGVADSDLLEYRAYVGTTAGFTPSPGNMAYTGSVTSFVHFNISYGVDTYYKLAAVDVFGTPSTYAVTGPIRPITPFGVNVTAPPVPTGLTATLTTDIGTLITSAAVSWNAVTDAENDMASYSIGYRPVGATDWQYVTVDYSLTTTKIDRLTPYVNYEFRVRAVDWAANLSAWSSTFTTNTATADSPPSQPSEPTASSGTLQVQVAHDKTKEGGGLLESDVILLDVFASTVSGFTASDANKLGAIQLGPATVGTFYLPATGGAPTETWYVRVKAVDRNGNTSVQSNQSVATPGLIAATNIIDATITNAKIASLAADKITAGTGFINDITVKSSFTLGDSTTDGIIESFGYASGTTGFKLAKTGLEINEGSIAAAALRIQLGQNIIPPQYADFEFNMSYYTTGVSTTQAITGILNNQPKYNTQYLGTTWSTATVNPTVYLGSSSVNYNVNVEPGETYIVSAHTRVMGSVSTPVTIGVKYSDGSTHDIVTVTPTTLSAVWTRPYGSITIPAGITKVLMYAYSTQWASAGGFDLDGVQIERKVTTLSTPSIWTPPSATFIDGGYIRTGEIRSSAIVSVNGVDQPAWAINTSGAAQFGNAQVRGGLLVGVSGDDVDAGQSYIASGNYIKDSAGWKVDSTGAAEFNSGVFRGILGAGVVDAQAINVGALDGKVLTGALIRTSAEGTRWETDVRGSRLYNVERISMGAVTITAATGVVTTSSAHNLVVGTRVWFSSITSTTGIEEGSIYYVLTVPSATTITISGERGGDPVTLVNDGSSSDLFKDGLETKIIDFPTEYGLNPTFNGIIDTSGITVRDNLSLSGQSNLFGVGAQLTLNNGASDPTSKPTVSIDWPYVTFNARAYRRPGVYDPTTNAYHVGYDSNGKHAIAYRPDGTTLSDILLGPATSASTVEGGLTIINGEYWTLGRRSGAAGTWLERFNMTTGVKISEWRLYTTLPSPFWPALGSTGTTLMIAYMGSSTNITVNGYSTAGSLVFNRAGTFSPGAWKQVGSVILDNFDFGASRFFISTRGSGNNSAIGYTFTTSGTTMYMTSNEAFYLPNYEDSNAVFWNSSIARFVAMSSVSPKIHTLTSTTWTTQSSIWWAANTWYQVTGSGAPRETRMGPKTQFTMVRRSRLNVSTPAIPIPPSGADPNNDPDASVVYLGRGSVEPTRTSMFRPNTTPPEATTHYAYNVISFSGLNPPATNNFPTASPAKIVSAAKRSDGVTPIFTLGGDGGILVPYGNLTADTGWSNLVMNAGGTAGWWISVAGYPLQYRVVANRTEIRGMANWSNGTLADSNISQLPSHAVPSTERWLCTSLMYETDCVVQVFVGSGGSIQIPDVGYWTGQPLVNHPIAIYGSFFRD